VRILKIMINTKTELEWKANENFDSGIVKTIEWYLRKYNK